MGRASLIGMLEMTDQDTVLRWHLQSNHYPPVPATMVEPCKWAIRAMYDGEPTKAIELPEGVTYRGMQHIFAGVLVDHFHLDDFLYMEESI